MNQQAQIKKTIFKRWWFWVIIIVSVIIIVVIGFTLSQKNKFNQSNFSGSEDFNKDSKVTKNLPECVGNELLSVPPVDSNNITGINPLGHLNPSGSHSIPMEHISVDVAPKDKNQNQQVSPIDVKAPGKIHIFAVRQTTYMRDGKVETDAYYSIGFAACKGVVNFFEDMSSISPALQKAVEASTDVAETTFSQKNRNFPQKIYRIDYLAEPGEVIGSVGGNIFNMLEWGAYDLRIPKLPFVGIKFLTNVIDTNTVCPLDYFGSSAKNELYGKLSGNAKPTKCGTNMQDVPDTIQGDWFSTTKDKTDEGGWRQIMSIVHDELDPSIGVIAIGGTITEKGGSVDFKPTHQGEINREPSEVKADGKIYCYYTDNPIPFQEAPKISGKIILQLINNHNLKIENQSGGCGEKESFNKPFEYER